MKNLEFCNYIRRPDQLLLCFSPVPFDSYIIPILYDAYINRLWTLREQTVKLTWTTATIVRTIELTFGAAARRSGTTSVSTVRAAEYPYIAERTVLTDAHLLW